MKSLKKLGAVFLALVLAFSLCATAFAANNGDDQTAGTKDDTGTVTVSGIEDESDTLGVTVYPILLAYYDANGNFAGYLSLYPDIITEKDLENSVTYTVVYNGTTLYEGTSKAAAEQARADAEAEPGYDSSLLQYKTDATGFSESQLEEIYEKIVNETSGYPITEDAAKALLEETVGTGYTFGDAASFGGTSLTADQSGTSYSADVAIGSYIVHVENSESVEYNVAVVSTWYSNENGNPALNDGEVNMIEDGNAWVKADKPGIVKEIVGTTNQGQGEEYEGNSKGTSVNIGDTVYYQVTVNNIPHYAGDYPVFNVTDTLSDGLTYNETPGVVINVVDSDGNTVATLAEETDYTLNVDGQVITIDFVVEGNYTLNNYEGYDLQITYSVTLNSNASLNQYANDNNVDLDYSVDSTVQGHDTHEYDKTHTYTFDLDGYLWGSGSTRWSTPGWEQSGSITRDVLTKTGDYHWVDDQGEVKQDGTEGEDTWTDLLSGAVFQIYTDEGCTQVYTNGAMENETAGITTDVNGRFAIYGLEEGTYYLKEITAPDGYTLNKTVYKIEINATYYDEENTGGEYGTLESWTITISAKEGDEWTPIGSSSFTVENESIPEEQIDKPADLTNYEQNFTATVDGTNVSFVYTGKSDIEGGTEYYYEGYATTENADGSYTDIEYQLTITVTNEGASVVWNLTETATVIGSTAEIQNTTTPELPNTGGIGTTLFYIIGALIIVAAIVLFVTMRRRNNRRAAE